jgi:hypothetical protein
VIIQIKNRQITLLGTPTRIPESWKSLELADVEFFQRYDGFPPRLAWPASSGAGISRRNDGKVLASERATATASLLKKGCC